MRKRKRRSRANAWSWNKLKNDERSSKVIGAAFFLVAIYLSIAFISYLYTWKIDQDKVLKFSFSLLFEGDLTVANWLGRLGAIVSNVFFYWGFGLPSLFIIAILFRTGWSWIRQTPISLWADWARNIAAITLFTSILLEYIFAQSAFPWGGAFGESSCIWLSNFIGTIGLGILLTFVVIATGLWFFNPNLDQLVYAINSNVPNINTPDLSGWIGNVPFLSKGSSTRTTKETPKANNDEWQDDYPTPSHHETVPTATETTNETDSSIDFTPETHTSTPTPTTSEAKSDAELEIASTEEVTDKDLEQSEGSVSMEPVLHIKEENRFHTEPYDPKEDLRSFQLPHLDLLEDYEQKVHINREELESNKDQIVNTLRNYKIEITKIRATVGPTVTLYEIVPAPGIKISKIKGLEDDIALSLAALGIRIIAPIPGKGTIGIEVPNRKRQIVALKDIIKSDKFQHAKMDLPIALGKTISNEVFVADLAKMPHLLVAGATGQGKSVGINAILMSLLYKKHPSQLKFVLVDPKKVELPIYNDIKNHYLASLPDSEEPIITDTTKVVHTLNSLCIEMDDRYDLLKQARARNIKEYNDKFINRKLNPNKGHRFLPFIVLVIDEFADLIMTAGKEIEMPIGRLAQLARAVGIHLIIATQRPSVKIITGLIKANFPARIAFRVTSVVDSRTILDAKGADQLIGKGDMLLSAGSDIIRLQCAFVDTPEVEEVIDHIAEQRGYPEPYYLPEYKGEEEIGDTALKPSDLDEMFEEAARLVVQSQHGSTSMLQRRFQLGYNRAGRIMDQLEALRVVGESQGSKAREVMVSSEMELEHMLKAFLDKN
jgi:S-DNA-T family DNA segregation ATPase FtsK/SpoIIIE